MKVELVRKIDFFAGVPACFILSVFRKITGFFSGQPNASDVQRIVLFQISEMGSAVSAYGTVDYLKTTYNNPDLYYVIFKKNRDVIELIGQIPNEHILTIRDDTFGNFISDTLGIVRRLRLLKPDVSLDLELFSRFSAVLSFLSGARYRSGFDRFKMEGLYRGSLFTHRVVYNTYLHISDNFFALAKAFEKPSGDEPHPKQKMDEKLAELPMIDSSDAEREFLAAKLKLKCPGWDGSKKTVLINPNASELLPLRRWPLQHYIELIRKILNEFDVNVLIIGLPSERKEAKSICSAVNHPNCLSFVGETSLKELIVLMNISAVLVSNDSGPPNFASMTTVKTLVFFGPETPQLYKPLGRQVEVLYEGFICSPCVSAYNHRRSVCKDNQCLKSIQPETAMNAVRRMLRD